MRATLTIASGGAGVAFLTALVGGSAFAIRNTEATAGTQAGQWIAGMAVGMLFWTTMLGAAAVSFLTAAHCAGRPAPSTPHGLRQIAIAMAAPVLPAVAYFTNAGAEPLAAMLVTATVLTIVAASWLAWRAGA